MKSSCITSTSCSRGIESHQLISYLCIHSTHFLSVYLFNKRLHMSEKFSSGTKNPEQTNKHSFSNRIQYLIKSRIAKESKNWRLLLNL